jgi:exodeoxyribonuclease VII large subunit
VPLDSGPENPLPLRTVARAITDWVGRLGRVWVEGQVAQLNMRPGTSVGFLTLRDTAADVSMQVTASRAVLNAVPVPLTEGARVVCWVKPEIWAGRGSLQLTAYEIRAVGLGALLARIEGLRKVLAAEGLFAADRKKALPFLPAGIGLVTGRASAAERDVVENARRRWPAVSFATREVAVQGPNAVVSVIAALQELDRDPDIDVIVLARGGGSVEDLLPFSDEALCRAVAACVTPVVSAIGHEPDSPLVDYVADLRCSTPTDAGKRIVPDVLEERERIRRARRAIRRGIDGQLRGEARQVRALTDRAHRRLSARIEAGLAETDHLRARVRALSPRSTLERGYAVVLRDGAVVRGVDDVTDGDQLAVRLTDGTLQTRVLGSVPSRIVSP